MAYDQPGTRVLENMMDPRGSDIEAVWEAEWWRVREEVALERVKGLIKPQHFQVFQFAREGKSVAEIAQALDINVASIYLIKHRVTKLLNRLAQELEV